MQCLVSVVCVWEVKENLMYEIFPTSARVSCKLRNSCSKCSSCDRKKFKTVTFDSITWRKPQHSILENTEQNYRYPAHVRYVCAMLEAVRGNFIGRSIQVWALFSFFSICCIMLYGDRDLWQLLIWTSIKISGNDEKIYNLHVYGYQIWS